VAEGEKRGQAVLAPLFGPPCAALQGGVFACRRAAASKIAVGLWLRGDRSLSAAAAALVRGAEPAAGRGLGSRRHSGRIACRDRGGEARTRWDAAIAQARWETRCQGPGGTGHSWDAAAAQGRRETRWGGRGQHGWDAAIKRDGKPWREVRGANGNARSKIARTAKTGLGGDPLTRLWQTRLGCSRRPRAAGNPQWEGAAIFIHADVPEGHGCSLRGVLENAGGQAREAGMQRGRLQCEGA
jgi:hypothetical protein